MTTTNRAKIVNNGEAFPNEMVGFHLAAGGDVTTEDANGNQTTHTGLVAGFHEIRAAKLVSGGPVEARWIEADAPVIGPVRPEITSPFLIYEYPFGVEEESSTNEVVAWDSQENGADRLVLKDFSVLPKIGQRGQSGFVDFEGIAALQIDGLTPTSSDVIAYCVAMSRTPVADFSTSIDTVSDGQTGVTTGNSLRILRQFGTGEWAFGNGDGPPELGTTPVVPWKWYQLTVQFHATAAYLRVNGVEEASGVAMPAPAVSGLTLGHGSVGGGTTHNHMAIAAMIVADGAPATQERDDIEAYLNARFARLLAA